MAFPPLTICTPPKAFFFFLSCFSASTKYSWMLLMYLVLRSQFLLFVLHDGFLSRHLKLSVYAKWKRITHFWVYFGKNLAISRIKGFTKVHLHNSKTAGCPSLLDIPIQKKIKGKGRNVDVVKFCFWYTASVNSMLLCTELDHKHSKYDYAHRE